MLYTADNPVSLLTLAAICLAALLAAAAAVRWPRTAIATLPILWLWIRWATYPVGYSSEAHIIPFRFALLLPIVGAVVGIAIRRRRAPA